MSTRTSEQIEITLSNRQQDRLIDQIDSMYNALGMRAVGESRHAEKDQIRQEYQAEHGKNPTSRAMATETKIHSYATEHKIKGEARIMSGWCCQTYGIKNLNQIKPEHIQGYFNELSLRNYAYKTIESKISSVYRIGIMLDKWTDTKNNPRQVTWTNVLNNVRNTVLQTAPRLNESTRAYENPQKIVQNIDNPMSKLVASLQLNHGLRVSDACKIKEIVEKGVVEHSKGGQTIPVGDLSADEMALYKQIDPKDLEKGQTAIKSQYKRDLERAVDSCGEKFQGKSTHGFRHNFAQYWFNRFRTEGLNDRMKAELGKYKGIENILKNDGSLDYWDALTLVSKMMGHNRPEITLQYLR